MADSAVSISRLINEAQAIAKDVPLEFGKLNVDQLNWRMTVEEWSVAQCLEHLIVANQGFDPVFDAIIQGKKETTLWERMPALPSVFGKLLRGGVSPESKRKFKAPKLIEPNERVIERQVVDRFLGQQVELVTRFRAMEKTDAKKIIITSPISKLITYSLLDACNIIVLHEQRHLAQAKRVTEAPGFPS